MTAYAADLQAVLYEAESEFCEVSSSFGTALSLLARVDLSAIEREMAMVPILRQRPFEATARVMMPFDENASFTLRGPLTGLGATAAGAVPSSDLATFLGLLVGNVGNALATGDTFTGGSAVAPETTGANGVAAGALVRGGSVGDGRMGGQFHLAASHATNVLTLLMAAAAAPNNGDVLYAGKMVYPDALDATDFEEMTSLRFRVLSPNGQYDLRGCYVKQLSFSGFGIGGLPEWEAQMGLAHGVKTSATFPSATVPQRHAYAPVVNGSFAIQAVGTTTRNIVPVFGVTIGLGFTGVGIPGLGGNYEGQKVTACRRVAGEPTLEVVVDKEAAGTDTWHDLAAVDPNAIVYRNAVLTASAQDGRAVGMAWPSLQLMRQPVQREHEGLNRQVLSFAARQGATTTTDLTASPWRLAMA